MFIHSCYDVPAQIPALMFLDLLLIYVGTIDFLSERESERDLSFCFPHGSN